MKSAKLNFPWLSVIVGILTAAYLYTAASRETMDFYRLPAEFFDSPYRFLALLILAAAIFFDSYRFHRRRQAFDRQVQQYRQRIDELLQSKNKLQHKARKYSDHADKLKLFISERLLEHIEYDEKFLHFRNLAAEVRHNGVICYDKVTASLRQALDDAGAGDAERYREALDSMAYLWVLLDLSTTDNIAMYIANKLYECEEQYYQQQLSDDAQGPPCPPTFDARDAVLKALRGFVERPPPVEEGTPWRFDDARFHVELDGGGELLGERNHLVLLTENLINNALFYADRKRARNPHARVAIRLDDDHGRVRLAIYNRGPEIPAEERSKIFQLGHSTKRARDGKGEHSGKGLGLYFVNEIAKGYEGEVRVDNIRNREDTYVLRVELAGGEKLTEIIHVVLDDNGLPRCRPPQREDTTPGMEYRFGEPVAGIEITSQTSRQTWSVQAPGADVTYLDPHQPEHPRWSLQLTPLKTRQKLVFKPLDIGGVRFTVSLPSARSRLDPEYHDMDDDALDDDGRLGRQFEDVSQYTR